MTDATNETPSAAADELETLYPGEYVFVRLRGSALSERIRIEPFYSDSFGAAISKFKPLAGALARVITLTDAGIRLRYSENDDPQAFMERIFESAENGSDAVRELVMLATGKPREWFKSLSLEGLADLTEAIWRQNKRQNGDFFAKRLWPQLQGLFGAQVQGGAPSTAN